MRRWALAFAFAVTAVAAGSAAGIRAVVVQSPGTADPMIVDGDVGRSGGALVIAARTEPKTFNPIVALDAPSRDVIWRMHADLIHINRETQRTEPALARSWTVSGDGLHYVLHLRRGVRFSDGHPFDADDVVFSFAAYLDERVHSPQRDLLLIDGRPIAVRKIDSETIGVDLPAPYAGAERLFDSVAMLPRHRLEAVWKAGALGDAWGISTPADDLVGLGPFRLERFRPGEEIALARNPDYWKQDRAHNRLPYLTRLTFAVVPSEEAQVIRLRAGELDVLNRVSSQHATTLDRDQANGPYELRDLGPGLEYHFLFFNQNDPAPAAVRAKQAWFADERFRRAISLAIDRASLVGLAYRGRATPIWGHVTPGNRLWANTAIAHPPPSRPAALALLRDAGFKQNSAGTLTDAHGNAVSFSILVAAGNAALTDMAAIIQEDLRRLGVSVQIAALDFNAVLARVLESHDYEACLLRLVDGDVDPNPEMNVWLSSGPTHLWRPAQTTPATAWEAEIDRLMRQQMTTLDAGARKRLYDRVQTIVAEKLPLVPLVSPNIIVAAKRGLGNFRPAVLDHYTLWNAEQLFWRATEARR
ncbi:MAG TPA: ABC transporter substrate-binding protein [Vicinamibacterales bacterium]|nr:ABC transporter substrate-binding protein [Vicinamibacterales bacterium]